jgi:hypothetical protein
MDSEVKIKVERPKGISREEAEDILYKALSIPREGNAHKEEFQDPAMQDLANIMKKLHEKIAEDIFQQISKEIDQETF